MYCRRKLRAEALEDRQLFSADLGWDAVAVTDFAGDANRDAVFDQNDIVQILQGGKYLSDEPADWGQGDFTGDGRFDQEDIVTALQTGTYNDRPYHSSLPFNSSPSWKTRWLAFRQFNNQSGRPIVNSVIAIDISL